MSGMSVHRPIRGIPTSTTTPLLAGGTEMMTTTIACTRRSTDTGTEECRRMYRTVLARSKIPMRRQGTHWRRRRRITHHQVGHLRRLSNPVIITNPARAGLVKEGTTTFMDSKGQAKTWSSVIGSWLNATILIVMQRWSLPPLSIPSPCISRGYGT